MRQGFYTCVIALLCLCTLSGCSMVVSGAQAVYNRHSIEKNLTDQYITMRAFQRLNIDSQDFKTGHVRVATLNGEVLLTGQVRSMLQRQQAEAIVKTVPKVKEIHNMLAISNPSSSLTRISDAWITTKVKTKLIAANELDATEIKVVTENGTVYLMGMVTPKDAQVASDIARKTDGVEAVVRLFSYMHITKHM